MSPTLPIKKTLYLCYFGLREPLVQTQVLPYLREVSKAGVKVSILTFEPDLKTKWTIEQIETERKKLATENINWYALAYHKTPSVPATFYDILIGTYFVIKLARKEKIDIFHARGHIPAPIGAIAKKFCGGKLLFDIRGFMPEEYTDAGVWKETSYVYKSVKRLEKWLMKKADGFVVLTEKARDILFPESVKTGFDKFGRPVEVIPCCIDAKRFEESENLDRDAIRQEMNLQKKQVFVYVGSFGGWYLTDEMVNFFAQTHRQNPDSFTMILTQRDVKKIRENLIEIGLDENDFLVQSVLPTEVPRFLMAADVAISFIHACYSKQSSSPTKIAEYLAAGLPIISNSGVGDLDLLIENEKVGTILNGFSENDFGEALEKIKKLLKDKNLGEHCREVAYRNFDLETVGGERYRNIYQKLLTN